MVTNFFFSLFRQWHCHNWFLVGLGNMNFGNVITEIQNFLSPIFSLSLSYFYWISATPLPNTWEADVENDTIARMVFFHDIDIHLFLLSLLFKSIFFFFSFICLNKWDLLQEIWNGRFGKDIFTSKLFFAGGVHAIFTQFNVLDFEK